MAVERGEVPAWLEEFARSFRAGESHAFILHGDVDGMTLVEKDDDGSLVAMRQRTLLAAKLGEAREVVALYSLAGGVEVVAGNEPIEPDAFANGKSIRRVDEKNQPIERIARRARALELLGYEEPAQPAVQFGQFGSDMAALIDGMGPQGGGGDPLEQAQSPGDALRLLGRLLRSSGRVVKGRALGTAAAVIDYADALVPAPAMAGKGAMSPQDRLALVTLLAMGQDAGIGRVGNPLFLICRDLTELHPDLRAADSGWKAIRIALPDRERRAFYLGWFLDKRANEGRPIDLDGMAVPELANLTAGLSLRNIEDVLLIAAQAGGLTRALLKKHKDAIIAQSYSEVAQMLDPLPGGFADLGGREPVKDWLARRVIAPLRDGRDGDSAKGVLLVGPPGTSKTFMARALARECGFNAVKLDAAGILGGIVGESERKLARFFDFCRALAPVLVLADEIDQGDLGKRGDTSGNPVAANLFNAMLQFMGDESNRGRVLVVLATNRPDKLDPALIRSGRIDAIIPMLLPDEAERARIVETQARLQGVAITPGAVGSIAASSDKYSAADLAEIVREARLLAAGGRIEGAQASEALADVRPSGTEQANFFTLIAVRAVNRRSLLPKEYARLLDDRAGLEKEVAKSRAEFAELAGAGRAEREW